MKPQLWSRIDLLAGPQVEHRLAAHCGAMAENTDVPENADENLTNEAAVEETAVQAPQPVAAEAAPQTSRLRDRMWSFRSMVAVAAATLLLGGAGGAALVAVTDGGHDRPDRMGRFADGPGGRGGPDGRQRGPQFNQNGPQQGQQQGEQEPPAAPGSSS